MAHWYPVFLCQDCRTGRGFATEALAAVLRYLVEDEGIARVTAWCAADNVGSRRAMEKAGMVQVAVEGGALQVGDASFDKLWYEYRGAQQHAEVVR